MTTENPAIIKEERPIVDFSYRLVPESGKSETNRLIESIGLMGERAESILQMLTDTIQGLENCGLYIGAISAALYEVRDMRETLGILEVKFRNRED